MQAGGLLRVREPLLSYVLFLPFLPCVLSRSLSLQSLWLVLLTVFTIGYGRPYIPETTAGAVLAVVGSVVYVVVLALLIAAVGQVRIYTCVSLGACVCV